MFSVVSFILKLGLSKRIDEFGTTTVFNE
jgi:hypothetical protein